MNIFIYSDESGVFDKTHNDIFVFGGLIILGQESKEIWSRKYSAVEKAIRKKISCPTKQESKACKLRNKEKNKLYRSLNNCYKFGVVIKLKDIMDRIFVNKKDKQRYLDYAFKIAIKKALAKMIQDGIIKSEEVDNIHFYVDEHTTATNGRYELREGLEQELKNGTYNYTYQLYYPPILSNIKSLSLQFCNSKSCVLIRASDIVANKIYYNARTNKQYISDKLYLTYLP